MARRLISIIEAAEYLGVTERHVRELTYRRELSFVKVGRALRFDMRTLDRFIERNTTEAEAS